MAWIIFTRPTPRYTVGTTTVPQGGALQKQRDAYWDEDRAGRGPYGYELLHQGLRVPEHLFPTQAHVRSSTKDPPDLLTIAGRGVSERFKELMERLEPGVHQFVHVPTFLRGGAPTPKRYYALVLGQVATHQIVDDLTTVQRKPDGMILPPSRLMRGDLVINRGKTAGWHAWNSADIYNFFTISDQLNALLIKEKVHGLDRVFLTESTQETSRRLAPWMELRLLRRGETDAAAALHRLAGATIPGYDVDLHTPGQDRIFYASAVWEKGPIGSVWRGERLIGFVATSPGWIDHLYVDPDYHRRGVGQALVKWAQGEQDDLQLWTFQSNVRARRFYAANGFTEEEMTDGAGNEEKQPDVRLRWRSTAS